MPILTDVTFTCGDLKGSDHSHSVALDIHKNKKKAMREGKTRKSKNVLNPMTHGI